MSTPWESFQKHSSHSAVVHDSEADWRAAYLLHCIMGCSANVASPAYTRLRVFFLGRPQICIGFALRAVSEKKPWRMPVSDVFSCSPGWHMSRGKDKQDRTDISITMVCSSRPCRTGSGGSRRSRAQDGPRSGDNSEARGEPAGKILRQCSRGVSATMVMIQIYLDSLQSEAISYHLYESDAGFDEHLNGEQTEANSTSYRPVCHMKWS